MFTVYSMPNCPHCINSKELLKREGKEFVELIAGVDFSREELVEKVGPVRTLPQIVLTTDQGAFHVGGYTDLLSFNTSGDIETLRRL